MEEQKTNEKHKIIPNDDMLEEIMVRLPVKYLVRFQIVSKHWRHTITSRYFRERHLLHQKTKKPKFLCLYDCEPYLALKTIRLEWSSARLVQEDEYDHTGLTSDEHKEILLRVSKSLDGLFLFYRGSNIFHMTRPIMVINPATRLSQMLPLAKIQLEHNLDSYTVECPRLGFGKDYVTGNYKLVWVHNLTDNNNNNNTKSSCEVFDFGAKQWRQVIPPPPPYHQTKNFNYMEANFLNGWLYWLSDEKTKFLAFDLHKDVFQIVSNPVTKASSSSSSVDLFMHNVDYDPRFMWILEKNGDGMQHVWRLSNHNTGGTLSRVDKMFSFDLNKITSTWFDSNYTSFLRLMIISKNGDKVMLSRLSSQNLLLFQPLNPTSIDNRIFSYSPPRPKNSSFVPYFPSLIFPL